MAEMSFCTQPLRSNSVFQFTMSEATEGFFLVVRGVLAMHVMSKCSKSFLYIYFRFSCEGEREQVEDVSVTVLVCHVKHIQHSMRFRSGSVCSSF